jgi:hypothetical protein
MLENLQKKRDAEAKKAFDARREEIYIVQRDKARAEILALCID